MNSRPIRLKKKSQFVRFLHLIKLKKSNSLRESLADNVNFITYVDYYLVCDALGQAWSFGSNWKHCLGLGKVDKNMVTFDPIKIPFFKKNNIFVVDVVASNEHALALDNKGNVYSWGVFEAEMKTYPVKDTFGSTINYTVGK